MSDAARREQLTANLATVEARIRAACEAVSRPRAAVTLVAVTKTWPASDAAILRDLGVTDLGENRDQEAAHKAAAVPDVRWHFVGRLQSNKARSVARYAHLVHGVDRPQLVPALSQGAERAGRVVEVLVQVSLDSTTGTSNGIGSGRGGASPDRVLELADLVAVAPGLLLRGVMAVAPLGEEPVVAFARLAGVAERVRSRHPGATEVSAGMSGDLEEAIAAGSTIVRVGSAILGDRVRHLG